MEPSPVLIAALKIHVSGIFQVIPFLQYSSPTYPGVEPYIDDIGLLAEFTPPTFGASGIRRQKGISLFLKPDV